MSKRTIADEARGVYDLVTLLAVDVASQLVVNGRGDALTVSMAASQREAAKSLLDRISASGIGGVELPERQIDTVGCGNVIDACLPTWGARTMPHSATVP